MPKKNKETTEINGEVGSGTGVRIAVSKKVRFEVFKRDKFTCQYCGQVAPNVILEVDHIKPVSKEGKNDILNLITSCWDCNRGKSNVELADDTAVAKQRKQMELLQERREQIELMFKWREELNSLGEDTTSMVVDYIDSKIENFSLSDGGRKKIAALTKKFNLADILESIDIASDKYLSWDHEGKLVQESVENFINKIGGVLVIKNRPPVDQRKSYIMGIGRNRFNYWDDRSGAIVLNNYVGALRDHGWDEQRILDDLNKEVIPETTQAKNWTEWRSLLEKWTEDIKGWPKNEPVAFSEPNEVQERESDPDEELDRTIETVVDMRDGIRDALAHIGTAFDDFEETKLDDALEKFLILFLEKGVQFADSPLPKPTRFPSVHNLAAQSQLTDLFWPINSQKTNYLSDAVFTLLRDLVADFVDYQNRDDAGIIFQKLLDRYLAHANSV